MAEIVVFLLWRASLNHNRPVGLEDYGLNLTLEIAAPKVNQATPANSADRKVLVNGDEQVLGAKTP